MKKWVMVVFNILVLAAGILMAVIYSGNLRTERTELTKSAFVSTVESMEQLSLWYLNTQQEYADNWGSYINAGDMTMDEALTFLRTVDSNEETSCHVIDVETFEGYSTQANVLDETNYSVSYSAQTETLKERLQDICAGDESVGYLHVTECFSNPINGLQVVGFGTEISLLDDTGKRSDYLLLRLVQVTTLQEQWIFPTGYEDAQIGIITSEGNYIVRSSAMKSENFMEFIRAYNDLTYPEADELQAQMLESGSGILNYKDARGRDSYWVYATLGGESGNWMIIGYIPVESLTSGQETDWQIVGIVIAILGSLFIADGAYFILINRRLRESMKAANQANAAKTKFLSSMSHDIRTPMNAIIGMTAIAERHLDDRERVRDCLSKVTLASNHLLTLINDILDISKVESGQFTLNPTDFSLPELTTTLANIIRPQILKKKQDFCVHTVNLKAERLYADPLRLNQIFINILSNAIKYTPEGGSITMTLEELPAEEAGTVKLIYTVADTGIGMSQEFSRQLFQPFVRAKDSRIDTVEGSGLGLAIVKQMVDAMKGTIEVQSEPDHGSVFRITLDLPIAEDKNVPSALPRMRALIADSDLFCLNAGAEALESLGLLTDRAEDGKTAVAMALAAQGHQDSYSVIILDRALSGTDGVESIRAIREKAGNRPPYLLLSAFDWSDIEEMATESGADGFLAKPVFRSGLYTAIQELLAKQKNPESPERFKESKPAESSGDWAEFQGLHLLIAEDNDMNWEIILEILGFYGITAERAENGAICVQKMQEAAEHTYAAILMDIQMPVMNGRAAAREIRKSQVPWIRDIPIIAMTADAFAEDVRACLDAGMDGHIAKPINMKQLLETLEKVLHL